MKKLNYDDEKVSELAEWLKDNFEHIRNTDSFEVKANGLDKKRIAHYLSTLNGITKSPPLGMQYCEMEQLVTIFDQR